MSTCIYESIYLRIENRKRKHTRIETHDAQTATRARMPPLDLKRLFEEERARRRAAAGASTSAAAAPDRLEALEARPAVSMADHDVGRFAARRISGLHYVPEFVTEAEEEASDRAAGKKTASSW